VRDPEGPRLARLGEEGFDFGLLERGLELKEKGAAGRCPREIGRESEDDVEL
jgi:hypothetical protein